MQGLKGYIWSRSSDGGRQVLPAIRHMARAYQLLQMGDVLERTRV